MILPSQTPPPAASAMPVDDGEDGRCPPRTIAVDEAVTTEAVSPLEGKAKKRKAEDYSHSASYVWKQHFTLLDEFHISRQGRQGHRMGYCSHCVQASQDPMPEQQAIIMKYFGKRLPKHPPKMQIYKKICKVHLGKCQWLPWEFTLSWQVKAPPVAAAKSALLASSSGGGGGTGETSVASSSMDIRSFAVRRGLTAAEIPIFHKLVFNLIIDTRNPFIFAEEAALAELVDFLRPGATENMPAPRGIGFFALRCGSRSPNS